MPQTLGELFNNLALKAGIASDDANLKSLLANEQLATIQVPDDLSGVMDKGLLNIEAAKNNHPDIKKKYFADAYDGMDKQLLKLVESDTFDDNDLAEITAEKSTSKKAELIVAKLKAAKKADKGGNNEEWNRKIAEANEAARLAKDEVKTVKEQYESKIKDIHLGSALTAKFGSFKTIYDELPGGIKSTTLRAIIDKELQDKNAMLITDDNGNLQIVGKDGSNVFGSNHVQLTAESFLNQSLAPILKVSGNQSQQQQTQQTQQAPATTVAGNAGDATNSFLKSLNEESMNALNGTPVSMM